MNPEKSPLLLAQLRNYCRFPWRIKFLRNENFSETASSCERGCLISSNERCS